MRGESVMNCSSLEKKTKKSSKFVRKIHTAHNIVFNKFNFVVKVSSISEFKNLKLFKSLCYRDTGDKKKFIAKQTGKHVTQNFEWEYFFAGVVSKSFFSHQWHHTSCEEDLRMTVIFFQSTSPAVIERRGILIVKSQSLYKNYKLRIKYEYLPTLDNTLFELKNFFE